MVLYGTRDASPQALLSHALRQEYGIQGLPEILRTELGKPYFPDLPHIWFSWSHSGQYILCALSGKQVGVDIEIIRPRRDALPDYAFSKEEMAEYRAMGRGWPAFYELWTRKEAWCKYTGEGLRLHWGQTPSKSGLYYGTYAGEDWRAAVCGREPAPEGILWTEKDALP